jgi:5'-methylthioadenosine phosphorylase
MKIDAAIIGGTGVGEHLATLGGRAFHVPTASGMLRGRVVGHAGKTILLLRRHSAGHKVPPHLVNYASMALGLRAVGVKACFATAAVGSLRPEWGPGTLVVPHDFLDLTARNLTLYDREVVHTDFSDPLPARREILAAAESESLPVKDRGVYVCGNGPRYESPHEIDLYGKVGDVVGMTASSEAILMHEAGVRYGCLAVVTNLACGIADAPLSHEEVVEEMVRSGEKAVRILLRAVAGLG